MRKNSIRIGTRGSKLALYQANLTQEVLQKKYPELHTEIITIKTKGDKILDTALSKIGDKGLFTKEIELALIEDKIDIAVHSLKDLATEIPSSLHFTAVLPRGEFRDALVHKKNKTIAELTEEDTIATSSLRRIASLKKINPKVKIVDIRGNVNTRLEKMGNGHCDGMIMAAAGLQRLGLQKNITQVIAPELVIPAVGQGAIAIECRKSDKETNEILHSINHLETFMAVKGERQFLNTLQGGCQVPVGCFSTINDNILTLTGFVSGLDGNNYIKGRVSGSISESEKLGEYLANDLVKQGGKEILDKIRSIT